MNEFKNVNFAPWIGKNYEKGIDERKILILGESHHWGEDIYDGVNDELRNGKYLKFTQQVVESYVDYQKGNKKHQSWMNTFTKFIKEFYNWEDSKINLIDFWDSVMFYNYVQYPISNPRISPTQEQFNQSEKAFHEILDKYQPDVIIVWGMRLWGNMPDIGKYDEKEIDKKYYKVGEKEYPAIVLRHPSAPNFCYSAYKKIRLLLEKNR